MATLYINRYDSRCGECGKAATPSSSRHDTVLGYWEDKDRPEPCMALFDSVASDYVGMKEKIQAIRPDLKWVGYD